MKLIKLTGVHGTIAGNYAIVDDEDYEELNKYKWWAYKRSHTIYARRNTTVKNTITSSRKSVVILMHRSILKVIDSKILIDHIDGNGLNNTRENIRIASSSQNCINRNKRANTKSKYIGVRRSNEKGWLAYCAKDGRVYSKYFKDEKEAAIYRNELVIKLHGEFAKLNIIE